MPQFLLCASDIHGDRFTLVGTEARHLLRVHRSRIGDRVRLFDGKGRRWVGILEKVRGPEEASGRLLEELPESFPSPKLILHQALLPRQQFEEVLEKGTELGIAAFEPVSTSRTVAGAPGPEKRSRWEALLLAAAKQSMRARLPELLPVASFLEALKAGAKGLGLVAFEHESSLRLRDALVGFLDFPEIHLYIGPEGGWSDAEIAQARDAGLRPFSLGPNILRSGTAALAAAACILLG